MKKSNQKQLERMYNEISKNDLPHDKIDRGLMIEILDKMIQIADWYFDNYCSDSNKARQIYENNLLCLLPNQKQ